jgi:hypothetical protein
MVTTTPRILVLLLLAFASGAVSADAGTLPDGRVYVVSNINSNGRDPLAITLSDDGLNFGQFALLRSGAPP